MANYYYTFDKAGKPARHEGKPPVKYERTTDPEEIKKAEETYREIWNERRKPKPSSKPEKPTGAEKPTGGEIRTNSNIKTGAVVSLNPERVREIFFSGCGEGITLQAMLQDPGKYAREWSAVKYVLTGEKEYKNEADKRWDEMLERMMDY